MYMIPISLTNEIFKLFKFDREGNVPSFLLIPHL